jgi:hypothetical protein
MRAVIRPSRAPFMCRPPLVNCMCPLWRTVPQCTNGLTVRQSGLCLSSASFTVRQGGLTVRQGGLCCPPGRTEGLPSQSARTDCRLLIHRPLKAFATRQCVSSISSSRSSAAQRAASAARAFSGYSARVGRLGSAWLERADHRLIIGAHGFLSFRRCWYAYTLAWLQTRLSPSSRKAMAPRSVASRISHGWQPQILAASAMDNSRR